MRMPMPPGVPRPLAKLFWGLVAIWVIIYLGFLAYAYAGPRATALDQVNRYRERVTARPLQLDPYLSKRAREWSEYLAVISRVKDPTANWLTHVMDHYPSWRVVGTSEGCCGTVREIVRAMWRCPDHRAILSMKAFKYMGVGIYRDDGGLVWLTLLLRG